jgi:hypothetical protein
MNPAESRKSLRLRAVWAEHHRTFHLDGNDLAITMPLLVVVRITGTQASAHI